MVSNYLRILRRRIGPVLLLTSLLAFLLAPVVVLGLASLDGRPHAVIHFPPEQLSLAQYWNIPKRYFDTLWASFLLAAVAAAVGCVLGVPAALGIVRGRVPGREVISALFRMPLQIPFVVTGVAFLQAYALANELIGVNLVGTFIGLAAAHMFVTMPYIVGTVVAMLEGFNLRLEEAALSLGASRWSTFRRVTMPIIMPGIYAGTLYAFIVSLGDVSISLFLASPRFTTFPVEMFNLVGFDFRPAMLAVSTLVVIFSLAILLLIQRIVGLDVLLRTGGGRE